MLDDDHGISKVAQVAQRLDEAVVVTLMEADAGLVEHIQHSGKPGADLCGEADALGLAAGEGSALAVELQVVQPHFI